MRIVEPEIDEAGGRLVAFQEVERALDEEGGAVPALDAVLVGPDPVGRRDVGMRLGAFPGAGVLVVAVSAELRRIGDVAAAAEVPLAEVGRAVTDRLEDARRRRRLEREEIVLLATAIAGARLLEARDLPAAGVASGQEAAPRRRTDRRGSVILREARPLGGEAVDVRSRRDFTAVAAEVARPQVVGQEDDDVRARL